MQGGFFCWDSERWDSKKSIQKIDKWNNLQIFEKNTLWWSLLQITIEWKVFQMTLKINECQNDVVWGVEEMMLVMTYIKFLMGSISNEAYQVC
jgi:hypothetical protein